MTITSRTSEGHDTNNIKAQDQKPNINETSFNQSWLAQDETSHFAVKLKWNNL